MGCVGIHIRLIVLGRVNMEKIRWADFTKRSIPGATIETR